VGHLPQNRKTDGIGFLFVVAGTPGGVKKKTGEKSLSEEGKLGKEKRLLAVGAPRHHGDVRTFTKWSRRSDHLEKKGKESGVSVRARSEVERETTKKERGTSTGKG